MPRSLASFALALATGLLLAESNAAELRVDAEIPAGNIVVERIEGDRVELRQDLRDTEGWWFYWHFRVRGAAGRTLTFRFTNGNPIGVRGPALSNDAGQTWRWLGAESVRDASFRHSFGPDENDVRFCFAMPYVEANLRAFLARHAKNPCLRAETLCVTKKGRPVERLHLGKLDGSPKHRVFVTCRHHACEMMASWALEGLMESVLDDAEHGRWLRENVEFLVVPFVDKDGVEQGDQGKNRKPHDHNRDYLGASIYPSVAAIRELVPTWSQGLLDLALDLHCPWIRGGGSGPGSNEQIVLVGGPGAETWARQQALGKVLQEVQRGPLVYDPKHNIPHGVGWNTGAEPRSCSRWAATLPGTHTAVTVELPYANAGGKPVTAESARAFGHDLARAIARYVGGR
ncbi:MAG: M14 family zinc carboxypeptidase [Thermoguttaceae bacterium]|jgi:hypothetical protein|nr:M14 family zinc carboxypeptidase [Thermoguttaceae bacterium]